MIESDRDMVDLRALRCVRTDGELVVVLVSDGEPHVEPALAPPFRIVDRDGMAVLDDVAQVEYRAYRHSSAG